MPVLIARQGKRDRDRHFSNSRSNQRVPGLSWPGFQGFCGVRAHGAGSLMRQGDGGSGAFPGCSAGRRGPKAWARWPARRPKMPRRREFSGRLLTCLGPRLAERDAALQQKWRKSWLFKHVGRRRPRSRPEAWATEGPPGRSASGHIGPEATRGMQWGPQSLPGAAAPDAGGPKAWAMAPPGHVQAAKKAGRAGSFGWPLSVGPPPPSPTRPCSKNRRNWPFLAF